MHSQKPVFRTEHSPVLATHHHHLENKFVTEFLFCFMVYSEGSYSGLSLDPILLYSFVWILYLLVWLISILVYVIIELSFGVCLSYIETGWGLFELY